MQPEPAPAPAPLKEARTVINSDKAAPSLIPVIKPLKSLASLKDKSKERKALQTIGKNNEIGVSQLRPADKIVDRIVGDKGKRNAVGKSPRKLKVKKENATFGLPAK